MKQLATILMLEIALMAISGCGGPASPTNPVSPATLAAGNWVFYVNSSTPPPVTTDIYPRNSLPLRGALAISSNTITASLLTNSGTVSSPTGCFPRSLMFSLSGEISGDTVTLTPTPTTPPNNSNLTITGTIEPVSVLLNTYTCNFASSVATGGTVADSGTVYGTNVPSLSGAWAGTLSDDSSFNGIPPVGVTMTLAQASTPSATNGTNLYPGTFALSGTMVFTSKTCFSSGPATLTIDNKQSYVTGELVNLVAKNSATTFNWAATLTDPTSANAIGTFTNKASLQSPTCRVTFSISAVLNKS